jgi:hypothetical protein
MRTFLQSKLFFFSFFFSSSLISFLHLFFIMSLPLTLQNTFLELPLKNALSLYTEKVVPRLTQRNKAIGLSVAIAMALVYIIRDRIFKPPKTLRHIPYLGYFNVLKSFIKKESLFERGYRVHVPHIDSNTKTPGLHLEPWVQGWEVHVSNPEDAKLILLKHGT